MAVFNTARLRGILVQGGVAQDPAATDFVEELNSQTEDALSVYPTKDQVSLGFAQVLLAIAEAEQRRAEMEARQARHINQSVGISLAALALAVGVMLGFG